MNLNSHFKQSLIQSILNDLPDPGYKAKAMELAKKYHEDLIPDVIKKLIKTPDIARLRQPDSPNIFQEKPYKLIFRNLAENPGMAHVVPAPFISS